MKSIEAIKAFKTIIDYKKDGTLINLYVSAKANGKNVYKDYAKCAFSYQAGYMQYSVTIDWQINNAAMQALGLHGSYNTNFQTMKFVDNSLQIKDDKSTIVLSIAPDE